MKRYFVSGIGTGVGKTLISAVLVEALKADYWKPVQCGTEGGTDRDRVRSLVSNESSVFHEEAYCFQMPASPNIAATAENAKVIMGRIVLPETENTLIIEGAGGLLVPLNEDDHVIDIAADLEAPVILVCNPYLGCINHTLLSVDHLLMRGYELQGIIFNGNFEPEVKRSILNYSEVSVLAEIPHISEVSRDTVRNLAGLINKELF